VANEKAGELAVLLSEVPLNKFFINDKQRQEIKIGISKNPVLLSCGNVILD